MAITYPLNLLDGWPGWTKLEFDYGDETSGMISGQLRTNNLRSPLIRLRAQSPVLLPTQVEKWSARLASLENGRRLFYGWGSASKYPIRYPNGSWPTGGAFSGVAAVRSRSAPDLLGLKTLPAGYVVSEGDWLSISYDGQLMLVKALEAVTADVSGDTTEIQVSPPLRSGVAVNDAVSVFKPSCHMMIVPGSVSAPVDMQGRGPISFEALQVVDV